jgi:RNA polymerase sigma-70 factor (ECF subfamily)
MDRLARGDRSAFEPLYAALRPRALRLAKARLGPAESADVAQAALLKVFAKASHFKPGRPCLPWFYAIVANEIRAFRRRSARVDLDDRVVSGVPDDAPDAEQQMLTRDLERALELAIMSLDDDGANAIRAMLGRAAVPKVPPATFRKRVSRAYAKLRLALGGHDAG